jgi:hypothetical protein
LVTLSDKWLNEARPEFARNTANNEWLITVPEPRKVSLPVFATEMVNLHVHELGSVVFPRETRGDDLLSDRDVSRPHLSIDTRKIPRRRGQIDLGQSVQHQTVGLR